MSLAASLSRFSPLSIFPDRPNVPCLQSLSADYRLPVRVNSNQIYDKCRVIAVDWEGILHLLLVTDDIDGARRVFVAKPTRIGRQNWYMMPYRIELRRKNKSIPERNPQFICRNLEYWFKKLNK